MAKAVLAALCVGAILGGVSACDGDYINKCDSDGCAVGSYTCPSACVNKRTLNSNGFRTCTCSDCYDAPPAPPPSPSSSASCEEQLGKDLCDAMGPLVALYGSLFALFVIIAIVCVAFPCIVFACAWCTCVQNKQALGRSPTPAAWAACCGIFWIGTICLGIFVIPFGYVIFSFIMIIPFCIDGCYTQPAGLGSTLIVQTQYAQAPTAPQYVQQPQQYAQQPQQYAQQPQQYAQMPQQGYDAQPVQAMPVEAMGPTKSAE